MKKFHIFFFLLSPGIALADVSSSTTITIPSGFMNDVLAVVSNFFATNGFLHDPLLILLAVSLGLLVFAVIAGIFTK